MHRRAACRGPASATRATTGVAANRRRATGDWSGIAMIKPVAANRRRGTVDWDGTGTSTGGTGIVTETATGDGAATVTEIGPQREERR